VNETVLNEDDEKLIEDDNAASPSEKDESFWIILGLAVLIYWLILLGVLFAFFFCFSLLALIVFIEKMMKWLLTRT
jgi:hypothetical protein